MKCMKGVVITGQNTMAASGRAAPEKRITHRYHGMDPIPETMDLFLHYDRSLIKPVIYND